MKVAKHKDGLIFEIEVQIGKLGPGDVQVDLYADGIDGGEPERRAMKAIRPLADADGSWVFGTQISTNRPVADYTARIKPFCADIAVPMEEAHILWQK